MKHSKITAIVLALCMLVTLLVVPVAAEAENLVVDGSFETWGATAENGSWTVLNPANGAGYPSTMAPVDTEKTDGDYSLMLKSPEGGASGARKGVYQSIGSFPVGTNIRISLKVNAVTLNDSYARFLVRFVNPNVVEDPNDDTEFTNNNSVGEAFPIQKFTAATDGWQTLTVESVLDSCNANKEIRIYFEAYSTDFEIYLDDFKAEVVVEEEEEEEEEETTAVIVNGDFEEGLNGWAKKNTSEIVTEGENSFVRISDAAGGEGANTDRAWISQDVTGLTPGKSYSLTFRTKSEGAYSYVDFLGAGDAFQTGTLLTNTNTSGAWKYYTYTWTQAENKTKIALRLMCLNNANTADAYALFDDVVLREANPTGDVNYNAGFETGTFASWTKENKAPEIMYDGTNFYAELNQAVEGIQRELSGLTPGKQYIVTFDVWTNAAVFYCDTNGTLGKAGSLFGNYTTNSQWENHHFTWTQPAGQTTGKIRFRSQGDAFVAGESCVRLDNVIVKELDPSVLMYNGGFEYGVNGLGERYVSGNGINFNAGAWKTSGTGTYSQVNGGMGGTKALQIVRAEATSFAQTEYEVSVTAGEKYIFTTYVKPGTGFTALEEGSAQFYLAATNAIATNDTASDYPTKILVPGDGWTPFTLVFTAKATATTALRMRTYGSGTILFDNFSLRKIDSDSFFVDYTKADGDISENLADGGTATITMAAADGDAGNVVALAVYSEVEGKKTLKSLQMKMITEEDVTAGYTRFELTADTVGGFATANYTAKLMTMKNGVLVPLQDVILYTEAQEV